MRGLILISLIFVLSAEAKVSKKKRRKKSRSKIVNVNFDDELRIQGKIFGPSIFTLHQKKNLNYGKLIKPRKNFLPEMRETLGDID